MSLKLLVASWAGSWLLGGCALYVPTVPSTPLLSKGQVQVAVGLRSLTSLEAGAAWAPSNHLLLSAESGFQGSTTTTTTNNVTTTYHDFHRQVGLGLGYYRAPTTSSRWYFAALGGLGYANTNLHAIDIGLLFILPVPYISGSYEASYFRYYGQVYAALPASSSVTTGFSVRSTWVDYARLTLDGNSLSPTNNFFLEPTLFLKLGNGPLQGMGTLGFSLPGRREGDSSLNPRTSPVTSLIGLSLIFRPDLLAHRQQLGD